MCSIILKQGENDTWRCAPAKKNLKLWRHLAQGNIKKIPRERWLLGYWPWPLSFDCSWPCAAVSELLARSIAVSSSITCSEQIPWSANHGGNPHLSHLVFLGPWALSPRRGGQFHPISLHTAPNSRCASATSTRGAQSLQPMSVALCAISLATQDA